MTYDLTEGQLDPPAERRVVEELAFKLKGAAPEEYLDFLKVHNGGEGFIGERYVVFWKAEEIVDFNREYEVEKYAPGILLFGSDGGGEGYGFDAEAATLPVIRIPFIGMERRYATIVARNFPDLFIQRAVAL